MLPHHYTTGLTAKPACVGQNRANINLLGIESDGVALMALLRSNGRFSCLRRQPGR